jgi:hypothetical protein
MKGTLEHTKMIGEEDLELCTVTDDPHEAVSVILDYLRRVGPPESIPRTLS